jgi:tetratricopeptide (TPR) repeat protein
LIKEIRGSPDRFTLTPLNQVNLLSVEASAYFVKNEPAQAGQLLETAVANNPQDTNLLATVASLYAKNKHYTNALVTLDRQLKIAPDDLSALISKGLVCFHLSAYDEAIQTLTHLLTLQTNNYNAMSIRAIAYLHSGQLDAAKKDYEMLQAIFPASYQVFYNLGDIAYRRKETNAAVRYYQAYLTNTVPNPAERKFVAARLKELKREKP